jgi:hypothetical protein
MSVKRSKSVSSHGSGGHEHEMTAGMPRPGVSPGVQPGATPPPRAARTPSWAALARGMSQTQESVLSHRGSSRKTSTAGEDHFASALSLDHNSVRIETEDGSDIDGPTMMSIDEEDTFNAREVDMNQATFNAARNLKLNLDDDGYSYNTYDTYDHADHRHDAICPPFPAGVIRFVLPDDEDGATRVNINLNFSRLKKKKINFSSTFLSF